MAQTQRSAGRSRSRNPERTRTEILQAALKIFAANGFDGARVQKIAMEAGCNPRLIYHYFGSKEDLYRAALRHIYADLRAREAELSLEAASPRDAIVRLTEFTYDFFEQTPQFVSITRSENLMGGPFLAGLDEVRDLSKPLIAKIEATLARGVKEGVFCAGMDALQLYVSIVALSAHHINAAHTLSATFGTDLTASGWCDARRDHVVALVIRALAGQGD